MNVKKSVEVSLRKADEKKHGHTRSDLCVEVKEGAEVKGRIEVKKSV